MNLKYELKGIEVYTKTLLECFYNHYGLWRKWFPCMAKYSQVSIKWAALLTTYICSEASCMFNRDLKVLKVTYAFFSIKWINALASPIIVTFTLAIACNSIITKSCNYIILVITEFTFISIEGYNLTWTWISVEPFVTLACTIISTNSLPIACGSGVTRN